MNDDEEKAEEKEMKKRNETKLELPLLIKPSPSQKLCRETLEETKTCEN